MKVTFIRQSAEQTTHEASADQSIMEVAVANNISEIEAECGGAMACATCHVYVHKDWIDKISPRSQFEEDMLEMADSEVRAESRLSCQIKMEPSLDGILIELPS